MGKTTIEWTGETWNPVRGCKMISPGCANCYAMRQAGRFSGDGGAYEGLVKLRPGKGFAWTGDFREVPDMLDVPLRRRTPTTYFVNSMSDLFGDGVSDGFIDHVLATMLLSPQHTFQILTKRSDRLPEYIRGIDLYRRVLDAASGKRRVRPDLAGVGISNPKTFPAPWVWWGVSVEDRKHGLPRIEHLRRTPAALRFLSIEPLLEDLGKIDLSGIDWVIVGGESGPGARPFDLAWARSIRDQCRAAGVAFFFKQAGSVPWDSNVNMGEYGDGPPLKNTPRGVKAGAASFGLDLKDKKGGDPSEWPADLQDCREMPEARHA